MSHQDIIAQIKDQHKTLRESIKILKQKTADKADKRKHLDKFIDTLKMHSEAEEEILYDSLSEIIDENMMVCEAYEEHSIAKTLISELEVIDYMTNWDNEIEAKAKVLAELVEHHAQEEEEEMLSHARELFTKEELIAMGEEFKERCENYEVEKKNMARLSPQFQETAF